MRPNTYVRFDWAMKRMLRDKANFAVLEGLLTVLLNESIHIVEILESESNQLTYDDKFNRVDIKARNSKGDIIFVEVRNIREVYFIERKLYDNSKAITGYIHLIDSYQELKKVYSINIFYFDIGSGKDYLYHGKDSFIGVYVGDQLLISQKEKDTIIKHDLSEISPEYYLIRLKKFNEIVRTPLEEWIQYLKTGIINPEYTAPGLAEVRKKLDYYQMPEEDRLDYDRYIDTIMIQNDVLEAAKMEGRVEARVEARAEGRAEIKIFAAQKMKELGLTSDLIMQCTGLSLDDIKQL